MRRDSAAGRGSREGQSTAQPARALRWSRLGGDVEISGRVWHFFTSVRLALILILLLAIAFMAAILLEQVPPSVLADHAAYAQWLDRARTKYGVWTGLFDALRLFDVVHSLWFRLLVGLLTINILVCTINRWKGIWTAAFRPRVRMGEGFFQHSRLHARFEAPVPVSAAAAQVTRVLSRAHYHVRTEATGDGIAVYADRYRASRFGTFLSHLAIVLILVGALASSVWGYKDPEFILSEGATRPVGVGTGISVRLEHFSDEYYADGSPKDYRSELVVYDHGAEVKRGTARVNSPVTYRGIAFHQSFYGQSAVMQVKDQSGATLFDDAVPLAWSTGGGKEPARPLGEFTLPQQSLVVYVIGPISGENDPRIPAGDMRVEVYRRDSQVPVAAELLSPGKATTVEGMSFLFERERRFTGLKIVKDPGVPVIWAACALLVLGVVMVFYFPHRRLWVLCKSRAGEHAEVLLATVAQRDIAAAEHFERLRGRLGRALAAHGPGGAPGKEDADV